MRFQYGKLPARPGVVALEFRNYASTVQMPDPPDEFGHENMVKDWGMLLNDRIGDCAIAGSLHETMLWMDEAGQTLPLDTSFSPTNTAAVNYAAITGYRPGPELEDPENAAPNPTDGGTDVAALCSYRRRYGLLDSSGNRHKIGAYLALEPGNWEQLRYAAYYFDGVGIGIEVPDAYQEMFAEGQPWDALQNPQIEGGHYITAVAWRDGMAQLVTWGAVQPITQAGYEQVNDETFAYLTVEKLKQGIDLQGLNFQQLTGDFRDLTRVG